MPLGQTLFVPDSTNIDDDFFTNVSISLAPSASSGPIALFQFDVPTGPLSGSASGTYELLGGVGLANQDNLHVVGPQNFTIA